MISLHESGSAAPVRFNVVSITLFLLVAAAGGAATLASGSLRWAIAGALVGLLVALSLKEGALMLIPSSAVETMGMGGMLGAAAMGQAGASRVAVES